MLKISSGRMLYYGKGDVFAYRTYAKPLSVSAVPESSFAGDPNVIFAHNITFAVSSDSLLTSFTEGDNSNVVATDSMKNFILRHCADYEGSTTEGLIAFVSARFIEKYPHISAIEIGADRIPFESLNVAGESGFENSGLVYRRSHNEHAGAVMVLERVAHEGAQVVSLWSGLSDLQLIKVSGSSFYGFIRDEYTTLPDSYDRPLFIFLNIKWRYAEADDALKGESGSYVAAEQVRDIAHHVFHEYKTPSIQYLIVQIGRRILTRFPQLAEIRFESNNRTWETVVEPDAVTGAGVFTEPRPPFGFQGFSMTREDLGAVEGMESSQDRESIEAGTGTSPAAAGQPK
ncbi:urate oxidase [Paenibacillus sp. sptzw28]|uniref:factor-independent urate hydroxylase n=1 Tax=Paenibacillus sp. sptzw28 TaxID=715179 RepID=UPI001C6E5B18|nr:urate oxidase [Paenibacillus sp. sptzw28]QYR19072.1 urate oxidase [Paenibacillus sp. sptzw28]